MVAHNMPFQLLRELASEYRQNGYRVSIYPGDEELPAFLKGNDIDLLAKNARESVVVAVRAADMLAGAKGITKLAERLEDRSGWRFELLVIEPMRQIKEDTSPTSWSPLASENVPEQLAEAESLQRQGHAQAAHLLAWAAAEAAMREALDSNGIAVRTGSLLEMVKSLYAYGLVNKTDYDALINALNQRNAVVHGYRLAHRERFNTRALIKAAGRLASESVAP